MNGLIRRVKLPKQFMNSIKQPVNGLIRRVKPETANELSETYSERSETASEASETVD